MGLDKLCAVASLSLKDVEEFLTVRELLITNFARKPVTIFKTVSYLGLYCAVQHWAGKPHLLAG